MAITAAGAKWVRFTLEAIGQRIWQNYTFTSMDDPVTIDTRPGHKTTTNAAGTNLWEHLSGNPQFFSLRPGGNRVKIEFEPSTPEAIVNARVTYVFHPPISAVSRALCSTC